MFAPTLLTIKQLFCWALQLIKEFSAQSHATASSRKVWRQTHCDAHTWRWDRSWAAQSRPRGFQVGRNDQKKKPKKPWRDVDGINVTDGSWCRLPVCLAGSAVSLWTSRWCTSTPRWRLTTTWTTPSWPSAATESPSKARGAVLSVSQTQKQCVEIHQLEMWLCKKTETLQLYVTLWPPLIGNIETKHTMAPSVKSRNNVLR